MSEITNEELKQIGALARRGLSAEEVYVFPVKLCDNETDRDCERFSIPALEKLAELFVGRTGIFDHDAKSANQTARIFAAEVVREPDKRTRSGEVYTYVSAKAYMMRTDSNADLIAEIDGGIKKEVSVSCAVRRRVCSLCGADLKQSPCSHVKGQYYGGRLCEVILDEATDAYEWSFVAVPAQPQAGITKALAAERDSETVKALRGMLDESMGELSRARKDITAEIIRLGQFCVPAYNGETVRTMCAGLGISELIAFKERTRKAAQIGELRSVLGQESADETADQGGNGRFKIRCGKQEKQKR